MVRIVVAISGCYVAASRDALQPCLDSVNIATAPALQPILAEHAMSIENGAMLPGLYFHSVDTVREEEKGRKKCAIVAQQA